MRGSNWSKHELDVLANHFGQRARVKQLSMGELIRLLPGRSRHAIAARGWKLVNNYKAPKHRYKDKPQHGYQNPTPGLHSTKHCLVCDRVITRTVVGNKSFCSQECKDKRTHNSRAEEVSPERILMMTIQIRAEWTESEARRRLRVDWRDGEVVIPTITGLEEVA